MVLCPSHTQVLWFISEVNSSSNESPYTPIDQSICAAMAEVSSPGEESSKEEEHDEDPPSRRGPVSPITAASPPHSNKKKVHYVRDYLQRLPKHQRRRIQKEIDKGYKPGDTT